MIKQKIRKYLNEMGFDIVKLGDIYRLDIYEQIYDKRDLENKSFLNVGGNNFYHPFWRNLDVPSENYRKSQSEIIPFDLNSLSPLPCADGSICIIYSSHTIEHVYEKSVKNLFCEAYRALKSGGILRITTGPDADLDYRALISNDKHWFYWDDWHSRNFDSSKHYVAPNQVPLAERWLAHVATQLAPNTIRQAEKKYAAKEVLSLLDELGLEKTLDELTSKCEWSSEWTGSHISWWNAEKIISFLKEAGFKNVYRSGYHQSVSPVMRNTPLFDSTHPAMSVYVEAIR